MRPKLKYFFLGIIVLVAFLLRFYQLGVNPPSLTWDEVAWGYNAYSLGIDGKDEFGRFLPVDYLESFGDFKPPVYAYLDILPIKIFGLTEFAVRVPSALFGTGTVLLSYFLIVLCFYKSKQKEIYGLLTALFLAISPWHILLSRAAFEANVANFFIVLGVMLFFLAVRKNAWFLLGSFIALILSAYTFNTARIVSPLLLGFLVICFSSFFLKHIRVSLFAFSVSVIISLPLFFFLLTPQAKLRYNEVNIFSDPYIVTHSNELIENSGNTSWSKIIHNRRFGYAVSYVKHFFDNFSPMFLFVRGDGNPKFSIQDTGQMYLWEFPFFIAGILFLFKKKEGYWFVIPYWLLISIVPAAAARETPHALRIESALPTFQFFSAYGLFWVIASLNYSFKKINLKYVLVGLIVCIAVFQFIYFVYNYFVHYPKEFSGDWQYGYKQAIDYVQKHPEYKSVVMTNALGRPYVYVLFYGQYSPLQFRKTANIEREVFGFVHVNAFDKYIFTDTVAEASSSGKTLFIVEPGKMPLGANKLKDIPLLNGSPTLTLYEE